MAKFKIGDKVVLKPDIVLDRSYNGITLSEYIWADLINKIKTDGFLTINGYGTNETVVLIDTIHWYVGEDALELYQYQPHTYKVGDIVRIKKREGCSDSYPFSFTDFMEKLAGTLCKITKIIPNQIDTNEKCKHFNGDCSEYELVSLDPSDRRDFNYSWHSSMFEPAAKSQETQQDSNSKEGDLVSICGIVGRIMPADHLYYLEFDISPIQEHISCCKKLREMVPNLDKIANKFGTTCNINTNLFPEFSTIDKLMQFVQAINAEYNSKQLTILKKSETYEIRFQKSKAISRRGIVPKGNTICGKKDKIAIRSRHFSYRVCHC